MCLSRHAHLYAVKIYKLSWPAEAIIYDIEKHPAALTINKI